VAAGRDEGLKLPAYATVARPRRRRGETRRSFFMGVAEKEN
jgi:hypothetical protein